ncbi:hypothetical protein DAH66_04150 [Sphingomonas koreensis]|uniref:Uncharacterized protein n=1 Tax=Sphingomonas koreensis TaxID=93064 RepID=A0A430G6R2_9SPHN|nr:hypothetical protein [Sphingomonas koreensis]RSY88656.1 hypothetical protein DAH66_04150 [Sphingomonas koreensis]
MKQVSLALAAATVLLIASAQGRERSEVAPSHSAMPKYEEKECLRNLKTKKRECRTRYEWRKIAARLAAEEANKAPQP